MALSPQKVREIVFQLLYSRDFEKSDEEGAIALLMRQHKQTKKVIREAKDKADSVWAKRHELDEKIGSLSHAYDFERIGVVERAILRLGVFELFHSDLPPKVAISEALRLTRKYVTKEAVSFVNALLDALQKERNDAPISENQVLS